MVPITYYVIGLSGLQSPAFFFVTRWSVEHVGEEDGMHKQGDVVYKIVAVHQWEFYV